MLSGVATEEKECEGNKNQLPPKNPSTSPFHKHMKGKGSNQSVS